MGNDVGVQRPRKSQLLPAGQPANEQFETEKMESGVILRRKCKLAFPEPPLDNY